MVVRSRSVCSGRNEIDKTVFKEPQREQAAANEEIKRLKGS